MKTTLALHRVQIISSFTNNADVQLSPKYRLAVLATKSLDNPVHSQIGNSGVKINETLLLWARASERNSI